MKTLFKYLASDTIESFANWALETIQIICDKTPSLAIRSFTMEGIFGCSLSLFEGFLLVFFVNSWRNKLQKKEIKLTYVYIKGTRKNIQTPTAPYFHV
jgi:hypothetical protein